MEKPNELFSESLTVLDLLLASLDMRQKEAGISTCVNSLLIEASDVLPHISSLKRQAQ